MKYLYGMRARPIGPGAQPKGILEFYPPILQYPQYWNIVVYDRPLTEQEISDYELDFLKREV